MKKRYQFGGNVKDIVPASRQNIEQRTPSGVRPVISPVIPVEDKTKGGMKHGGELKSMKKPKKMAFGGPAGPAASLGKKPGGNVTTMPPAPRPPGMGGGFSTNPNNPTVLNHFDSRQIPPPGAGGMPIGGGSPGGIGTMPVGPVPYNRGLGPQIPFDPAAIQALRSGIPNLPPGAPTRMAGGMFKKGGKVKMASGGKVNASTYNDMTGGAGGGIGRLEKTSIASKTKAQKLKTGGKVKGYADGGPMTMDEILAWNRKHNKGFKEPSSEYLSRARSDFDKSRAAEAPEYRARQDKREKDAAAKKSIAPRPRTPEGSAHSGRGTDFVDARAKTMRDAIGRTESNMAERDAARARMKDDAFRAMLQGKQRTSAIGGGMSEEPMYPMTADETRNAASEMGVTVGGMKRGGKTKMAKGGKAEAFEGTAKDMAQDKKLAKKRGMSLADWEKSSADTQHDKQRSMAGLKKGGHVKGCKCMACGGMAKYAAGGMSTAQDGMKPALRPKPSGIAKMAKGGKVVGKTFGKPLPGTKVSSKKIRSTVSTGGANMKKDGMKGQLRAKASGAKPTNMMKPLGMTKMAAGGKVRGTGIAQRGTKFIGEV